MHCETKQKEPGVVCVRESRSYPYENTPRRTHGSVHAHLCTHTHTCARTEPCDTLENCFKCPNTQNPALSMFSKTFIYLCIYLSCVTTHAPSGKKNVKAAETPPFRQLIVKSILSSTYIFFLILWAEESVVRAVGKGGGEGLPY